MTHEFKTPISTIASGLRGYGDSDVNNGKDNSSVLPFIDMIRQENRRLEILVESILESAALEKQNIQWGKRSKPVRGC